MSRSTGRRQWGSEKPRPLLPSSPAPASTAATWMGGLAIALTIGAYLVYLQRTMFSQYVDHGFVDSRFIVQSVAYVVLVSCLTFSALMYLLARQGSFYRSRQHVRAPRAEIDAHFSTVRPTMTVLVPSYREDPAVVRSTLLSVALQEFPSLRVVLLIDDDPNPTSADAVESLAGCRALPAEVGELLRVPRDRFTADLESYAAAGIAGGPSPASTVRALARDFDWAAEWLEAQAAAHPRSSTAETFVADEVFLGLAGDFRATAQALFASLDSGVALPAERVAQLHRRLVWTFSADLRSFERKRYAHLSHEANKAMNLNAYIGLMGSHYRAIDTRAGLVLRSVEVGGDVHIPDSDYLLTLDADSVLMREYCLRLVHHLDLPGNERIAVIQTPYSAFRGAETRLERIAGATTDIQHILHQGMTHYDATFWVGANAVIRKVALDDIVEVSYVDGHEERRYIQDRTVIEDTESSIDLVAQGWSLYNYGERLSYSATPPDFGALSVQRARWANGGLLIIPSFWRYLRAQRKGGHRVRRTSSFLRINYMGSIAWASLGLVGLLVLPFDSRLLSPVVVVAALPYFTAMSYDLHRLGYKRSDVFRIYGFNLILLPVNIAGVLKSLQQAAAKSKIAFARTPKVKDRTATPALYVLFVALIAAFSFWTLRQDFVTGNWGNAPFAASNGVLTVYALVAFMGVRNSVVDVVLGAVAWVRVPVGPDTDQAGGASAAPLDWESVLYYGPGERPGGATTAVATAPGPRRGDTRSRHRDDGGPVPREPHSRDAATRDESTEVVA